MSIGDTGNGAEGIGSTSPFQSELIVVPSNSFNFTANPPAIIEDDLIVVPSNSFNFTAQIPTASVSEIIVVPSNSFNFIANPPNIIANETIIVPSNSFNFTANPPVAAFVLNVITFPAHEFIFTPNVPNILFESRLLERTVNASETGEAYIILLTIQHPDLSDDIRISNDPTQLLPTAQVRGTISNGDEYIFLPFDFAFPNQEPDTSPRAQLRIDNVSREISTIIDSITSSPTIQIDVVLSSTPDIIELQLKDFKLNRTETNIAMVIGDITVEHFDQEPYPAGRFNPSGFPGLFAN